MSLSPGEDPLSLLRSGLAALDLTLPPDAEVALLKYLDLVLAANQTMNLTAITDPAGAVHKHLVDCLAVLQLKDLRAQAGSRPRWADVGSGAGFPGLPLALAVPDATLDLIESTTKKALFLEKTAAELGLGDRVKVHNTRAETLGMAPGNRGVSAKNVPRGTLPSLRGSCHAVFFRGVSRLAALVELGAPLLKMGGLLVAYKGPKAGEELAEAGRAMRELRMGLAQRLDFELPGVHEARVLVCLRKTGETPRKFPRLVGTAQKEPLV